MTKYRGVWFTKTDGSLSHVSIWIIITCLQAEPSWFQPLSIKSQTITWEFSASPKNACPYWQNLQKLSLGLLSTDKKLHLTKWETVTKRKKFGGLGLKNSSVMNAAFMAKLKWEIKTNDQKPWVTLFKSKYKDQTKYYRNSSYVYKSITKDLPFWLEMVLA